MSNMQGCTDGEVAIACVKCDFNYNGMRCSHFRNNKERTVIRGILLTDLKYKGIFHPGKTKFQNYDECECGRMLHSDVDKRCPRCNRKSKCYKGDELTTFDEYQRLAGTTAIYPNVGDNIYYPALGLGGEAGEVLNKVKKIMRDCHGKDIPDKLLHDIKYELGDVLWYIAQLCTELRIDMSAVADDNIDKLRSRKERGKLKCSGADR